MGNDAKKSKRWKNFRKRHTDMSKEEIIEKMLAAMRHIVFSKPKEEK